MFVSIFCRVELMVRVAKLILHYYLKITSFENDHINASVKYKVTISQAVQEYLS